MSNYEFDLPIPKSQRELLLSFVDKAKEFRVLSAKFFCHIGQEPPYTMEFVFSSDKKGEIPITLPENPVPSFEVLGFIHFDEKQRTIVLTPKLFKWAEYEKKTWFGKFWARQSLKDIMLGIAFILSLLLSLYQVLEVLQKIKVLPMP